MSFPLILERAQGMPGGIPPTMQGVSVLAVARTPKQARKAIRRQAKFNRASGYVPTPEFTVAPTAAVKAPAFGNRLTISPG